MLQTYVICSNYFHKSRSLCILLLFSVFPWSQNTLWFLFHSPGKHNHERSWCLEPKWHTRLGWSLCAVNDPLHCSSTWSNNHMLQLINMGAKLSYLINHKGHSLWVYYKEIGIFFFSIIQWAKIWNRRKWKKILFLFCVENGLMPFSIISSEGETNMIKTWDV